MNTHMSRFPQIQDTKGRARYLKKLQAVTAARLIQRKFHRNNRRQAHYELAIERRQMVLRPWDMMRIQWEKCFPSLTEG